MNQVVRILTRPFRGLSAWRPLVLGIIRRASLLPLLLPILMYAGAHLYLQRSALSVLDKLIARLPDAVEFRFAQLDAGFDGGVDIQGASLLLPGMSLPVQFQRLHLSHSHWRELPAMARDLDLGLLPGVLQVEFTLAETELSRLAAVSRLPIEAARLALGCFQSAGSIAAPESEALAVFAGRFDYRFDPQTEYLNAQLQFGAEQRYQVALSADLDIGAPQLRMYSLGAISLGSAELRYLNLGAQSALLRDCGATTGSGLVEGGYVAKQGARVKQRLALQGWVVSTELELAYQDYLFLPLQLNLQLSAAKAVSLQALADSPALWGQFAVRVGLNTPQADHQGLRWLDSANQGLSAADPAFGGERLRRTVLNEVSMLKLDSRSDTRVASAAPESFELPLELRFEEPGIAASRSPLTEAQLQQQLQQSIRYQPSYQPVLVTELSGLLGVPLRLTTHNGRQLEGVLEQVEFDRLQLRSEVPHGTAILPVRLDIISAMQAYF